MDQQIVSTARLEPIEVPAEDVEAWLSDIRKELGGACRHRALGALRGVLHAIRDLLTVEEAARLGVELPTLVRGIYFERWAPRRMRVRDRRLPTFLGRIRPALGDFADVWELYAMASAVLGVLVSHISPGEAERLHRMLPKGICEIWQR